MMKEDFGNFKISLLREKIINFRIDIMKNTTP